MAILKKIRSGVDKVRKKYIPTFGEQFDKAKKEGKKTFKSTRDDKKKGKLEYSTMTKKEVDKKRGRLKRDYERNTGGKGGGADSGKKPVYEKATGTEVSSRGQAFAKARKEGKKTFMYKGKMKPLRKGPKPGSQSYQFQQTSRPEAKKDGGMTRNTRRMNRLEELGRVDAEKGRTRKGKRNLRDEKKRIVRELKR